MYNCLPGSGLSFPYTHVHQENSRPLVCLLVLIKAERTPCLCEGGIHDEQYLGNVHFCLHVAHMCRQDSSLQTYLLLL